MAARNPKPERASDGQNQPPLSAQTLTNGAVSFDDHYQRGYEAMPEDPADAEALLPHLPLAQERWE
ncbi:MAG TPA: hypothetical protein VH370_23120 [Humisphaera sp.]|nr:hypothetical protein [Humisphaera sp.]